MKKNKENRTTYFPEGFLFGSATAAHQVEGGQDNDWSDWERKKGHVSDDSDSSLAADSWNKWREDVDLLKKTNQNAYRFSIEWSRIEPQKGVFDQASIKHYREILLELKKQKISSMVTLFHFTLPKWFSDIGGFSNRLSVYYFSRFAEKLGQEFGKIVDYWVTINEPQTYLLCGYVLGNHCPGKRDLLKAYFNVRKNLEAAHIAAYRKMKPIVTAPIGIVEHLLALEPLVPRFLNNIWVKATHFFTTHIFIKPIINSADFIGINYYMKFKLQFWYPHVQKASKVLNDYGWGINQEGLSQVISECKKWKKPIFITENGVADSDDIYRKDFIKEALENISEAIKNGADVRGYFHWSLLDNFEWSKGYSMKFGLFTIDRKPRKSALLYADLIKQYSKS